MFFDLALILRLIYTTFTRKGRERLPLTPKRFFTMMVIVSFYFALELVNWICFLIDELFFSEYREVNVKEPVMIAGMARSGTTFIQRLFASDEKRFTSMRMWEIILAPSIVQKRFFLWLWDLDGATGRVVSNVLRKIDAKVLEEVNKIHPISLFDIDEDELVMLHFAAALHLYYMFPYHERHETHIRFDSEVPLEERARWMRGYELLIKKHLYVFGPKKTYLLKNPSSSSKVVSLLDYFPDGKFIYMLRNPLETTPSYMSLIKEISKAFIEPDQEKLVELGHRLAVYWYDHPLAVIDSYPKERAVIQDYKELVQKPKATVERLCKNFGIPISDDFAEILRKKEEGAKGYKRKHHYTLEQYGITEEEVREKYASAFERLRQMGYEI